MSLLRDLTDLADRIPELPNPGMEIKLVDFFIDIRTAADTLTVSSLRGADPKGKSKGVPQLVAVLKRSGSKAPPILLSDNLQYVAAVPKDDGPASPAKARALHDDWTALIRLAATEIGGNTADLLNAAAKACTADRIRAALAVIGVSPTPDVAAAICNVSVDGVTLFDLAEVREWWAVRCDEGVTAGDGVCQITGRFGPLAYKFPAVRGLPGNQPTLVSANFAAAERYDASQGTGARVSVAAAQRSHAALNWLLANEVHRTKVGDTTLVWWVAEDPTADVLGNLFDDPTPGDVEQLVKGIWIDRPMLTATSPFRAVLLTVSTARVVVRSDHTVTLARLNEALINWHAWQAPSDALSSLPRFGLKRLVASASRPSNRGPKTAEMNRLLGDLLALAISGRPVPIHHLASALLRCHADHHVPDERAALISLIIRSNRGGQPLDATPAYLCGAIFAEYEYLQYQAFRPARLNRTITDTYFSSAMTNPSSVLGAIAQKGGAHLGKLRRDSARGGVAVAIERRIAALANQLGEPPKALSREQQAEFVLGYWQTRHNHLNPPANAVGATQHDLTEGSRS